MRRFLILAALIAAVGGFVGCDKKPATGGSSGGSGAVDPNAAAGGTPSGKAAIVGGAPPK